MSREFALWLGVAALVALAGVLAGRSLKGSGPESYAFEAVAPPYTAADTLSGKSRAGFDGFSTTGGLDGQSVVAGRVSAVTANSVTLTTSSGANTIRITGQEKVRSLQPFSGAIAPGATVIALLDSETDEVDALLLLLAP